MTIQLTLSAAASSTEFAGSFRVVDSVRSTTDSSQGMADRLRLTTPTAMKRTYYSVKSPAASKPAVQPEPAADDAFDALMAEAEADPLTAQALQDGRRWVQQQYYGGECLASLRLSRGLSQAQLAERCGMNQSHISRYEAGDVMPQAPNARRLAEQLGVTVDVIFSACERSRNKAD